MVQINEVTTLEIEDGVAIISIDSPPVNAMSMPVIEGIDIATEKALEYPGVQAVVMLCKGRTFIAGADLKSINSMPANRVDFFVTQKRMEDAPVPFVAAIHGTALGGGLETAMVFHFRVAVPSARFGLPEVKLGLLPGGGGTQRLPRLVGAVAALDVMTKGDQIDTDQALAIGLIDQVVEEGRLREGAIAFAKMAAEKKLPLKRISALADKITADRANPGLFDEYRKANAERMRNVQAIDAIIRCVEAAVSLPFAEGMAVERSIFAEVRGSAQNLALLHNFFAEREAAKIPGLDKQAALPALNSFLVLGSAPAADEIAGLLGKAGKQVVRAAAVPDEGGLVGHDVIVDAAATEAERAAIVAAAATAPAGTAFLTVTAAEQVGQIKDQTGRPDLTLGLQLGSSRLIEVARTDESSPALLAALAAVLRKADRVPIIAGAGKGLIVGRMAAARDGAVQSLSAAGVPQATIDAALRDFGFPGDTVADLAPDQASQVQNSVVDAMIREGKALLEEGVAWRGSDIDLACINALGFPAYHGGPMFMADQAAKAA